MERQVIQDLTSRKEPEENMKPVDSLVLSLKNMVENTYRVLEHVRNFKVTNFGESQILDILKLQKLVKEYCNDDN